jgi:hypothetical protein
VGDSVDHGEVTARLARIKRRLAELESECGRTAELREQFERLMREIRGDNDVLTHNPQKT